MFTRAATRTGLGTMLRREAAVPEGISARAPTGGTGVEPWDAVALRGARIEVFDDLSACEDLWRSATERCACTVFQTYEWLAAWREAFPAPGREEAIVRVAGADGATLLLLPLGVSRRLGGRCLEFLGGDLCDYNAPVIDRDLAERMSRRDVARLWEAVLARLPAFDWLDFRRMPPLVDGAPNPLAMLECRPADASHAAHLPGTFEAFAAVRSRGYFAQNRRHRRRLEREAGARFAVPDDPADRLALLRFTLERKAVWQRDLGLAATFGDPRGGAFYERLTRTPPAGAEVVVAALKAGDAVAAGLWGVIFRGEFLFLVTSYDPGWAAFRPGRLLMEDVVRFCIGRGLGVFDLTVGDESYKADWADRTTPVFEHVASRTLVGAAMLGCLAAKRRVARSALAGRLATLRRNRRAKSRRAGRSPGGGDHESGHR